MHRKTLRFLPLLFLCIPVSAMQRAQGWCEQGGARLWSQTSSGSAHIQRTVQQSYPSCTVTVYLAGTGTLATIFSTSSGTGLSNPFSANQFGIWNFYAADGHYDVQLSGGGLAAPFTLGDYSLSSIADFGLPATTGSGCLSLSAGVISTVACGNPLGFPGGPNGAVQYRSGTGFAGDANLVWSSGAQILTLNGVAGNASLLVNNGFVQSGGFFSQAGSWQGFNTNSDGALLRGVHLGQNAAGTSGGYINIAPITYGTLPLPLPGLSSFGANTALIWVAGVNNATPNTTFGINTNLYISAAGGLAGLNTLFNTIQAPFGGSYALSFTALNYVQAGRWNSATTPLPAVTSGDTLNPGALSWDLNPASAGLKVYNGSAMVPIGGGGGGSCPGGATNGTIQFNSSGVCAGSSNLLWDGSKIVATAGSTSTPGLVVLTGFAQSDLGFVAIKQSAPSTALPFNVVQAPTGGMYALSFTASKYIQMGLSNGPPTLTTSDALNPGLLYCDGTTTCVPKFWNGSAYITLATGGATSPGGVDTNVQINSAGSFGGSSNLTYSAQLLRSKASSAAVAGMFVETGFMQADEGFLGTAATCTQFNCIQAPGGGLYGLSLTALNYVNAGNWNSATTTTPVLTVGDSFHAGALAYDLNPASPGLKVYDGAAFVAVGGTGGSCPSAPSGSIQFNSSSTCLGSANLVWNNAGRVQTISATAGLAGLIVLNGTVQADIGFNAVNNASPGTALAFNAIQAQTGGMFAKSFTAINYVQLGRYTSGGSPFVSPPVTTSDAFQPGAVSWDNSRSALAVFNGSQWNVLATGGVLSLNSLTGALNITAVPNQTTVTAGGTTIQVGTVQSIGTTSTPTFQGVIANGAFNSTVSGTTTAFQSNGGTGILINGRGDVSGGGSSNFTGGAGLDPYRVSGTGVIDSSRNLININSLTVGGVLAVNSSGVFVGSGVNVGVFGIQAAGYNVTGGFIGQNWNIGFSTPFTINGAGSFTTLVVKGGIITSAF
jgi:hypothetical protein